MGDGTSRGEMRRILVVNISWRQADDNRDHSKPERAVLSHGTRLDPEEHKMRSRGRKENP